MKPWIAALGLTVAVGLLASVIVSSLRGQAPPAVAPGLPAAGESARGPKGPPGGEPARRVTTPSQTSAGRAGPPVARPASPPPVGPRLVVRGWVRKADGTPAPGAQVSGTLWYKGTLLHNTGIAAAAGPRGDFELVWPMLEQMLEHGPFQLVLSASADGAAARQTLEVMGQDTVEVTLRLEAFPDPVTLSGSVAGHGRLAAGLIVWVTVPSGPAFQAACDGQGRFRVTTMERLLSRVGAMRVRVLEGNRVVADRTVDLGKLRDGSARIELAGP